MTPTSRSPARRCLAFAGIATALCMAATAPRAQTPAQLDSAFATLAQTANIVGLSAAVINDGTLTWSTAFGIRHGGRPERVDRNTVFAAAGLTEPVVAYAVLRLASRGLLDLDRPIAHIVSLGAATNDPRHARITPRMVLSHSTGLTDGGRDSTRTAFEPGTNWAQSTKAFAWLGTAVERVTRLPLSEIVRREVFEPLDMRRSYLVSSNSVAASDSVEPNGTMAHEEWGLPQPWFRAATAGPAAATGLRTTAEDYAKFVMAVMEGRGLEPATARQLFSMHTDARNATDYASRPADVRERIAWGLGWGIERRDAGPFAWHWGDGGYDKSFVMVHPAARRAVVYFTNSQTGLSIMSSVVSLVMPGRTYAEDWLGYWQYDLPTTVTRRALVRAGRSAGATGAAREYETRRARRDSALSADLIRSAAVALGVLDAPTAGDTLLALAERDYPDSAIASIARGDLSLVEFRDARRALRHYARAVRVAPNDSVAHARARWARKAAELRSHRATLQPSRLAQIVGAYGTHRVSLENGHLYYEDESAQRYELVALRDGVFAANALPNVRFRFAGPESGQATTLIRLYWDGDRFEDARTK